MEIEFDDTDLERLAFEASYMGKWSRALIRAYRKRVTQIMQVPSREILYTRGGLHLKKLHGKRRNQHSMRLNEKDRLIIEFKKSNGKEIIHIVKIEDYH